MIQQALRLDAELEELSGEDEHTDRDQHGAAGRHDAAIVTLHPSQGVVVWPNASPVARNGRRPLRRRLGLRAGDAAEASVKARQEGRDVRPKVQAKRVLRDRLLRETFQRPDDVSRALGMAGKSQSWPDIAAEMPGSWTPKALKKRLSAIVGRRNAIVHEGDYERQQRPRTAKPIPIEETEAKEAVEFLANLVRAIRSVISA